MARRKRPFQTRLSRSGRMRSATVKRALGDDADRVKQGGLRRPGVEHVDSTAALDAVIADRRFGALRSAAVELGWLGGITALVAVIAVWVAQPPDQAFALTPETVDVLLVVAAAAGVLGLLIVFRRWRQGRMAFVRLTPEQRRCTRSTGTLRVQDRLTPDNAHEHRLRAPGSDWMVVDAQVLEGLEPIMEASQRNDLNVGRRTENDVAREWVVREASILFHHGTRTILEIHDANGELVYRHPRYRPPA